MQKIQSGSARGRSLKPLPKSYFYVRPILGRIKKSLFDILQTRIKNARFLDVFAGTGSVGIEALSRGADFCCFVELDGMCVKLINENLQILKFSPQGKVVRSDALGNLAFLPGPFDIIFLGPPYVDDHKKALALSEPSLKNIAQHNLLSDTGLVIVQHHKKEFIKSIPPNFALKREEQYGDTVLSFFSKTIKPTLELL